LGTVQKIITSNQLQEVFLKDGTSLTGRLVVVGTGPNSKLAQCLGMKPKLDPLLKSITFGFDIELVEDK